MNTHKMTHAEHKMHYGKFALMILLSFIAMYVLMYAMVDRFANVVPNINQFYMAGLMTAPMITIEMLLMGSMYKSRRTNAIIIVIGILALGSFFMLIRYQTAVSDKQFLKSMIPHHAGAILMVEEADLSDPEIKKLAADIISSQQKEIDFMKAKLEELESK
jgi:uncharacterized protein (DUF305 family)